LPNPISHRSSQILRLVLDISEASNYDPNPAKIKIDRQGKILGIIYNNVDILSESKSSSSIDDLTSI
jgi:hypothetical protein